MTKPTPPAVPAIALEPLREAMAAVQASFAEEVALGETRRQLAEAEPELVRKAASGDVQAAAALTVNRCKTQVLPEELKAINARQFAALRQLQSTEKQYLEQWRRDCATIQERKCQELSDLLLPSCAHLLTPGASPDFSAIAGHAPDCQRAVTLLADIGSAAADYPETLITTDVERLGGVHGDYERTSLFKLGKRMLAAGERFHEREKH